MGRKWKFPGTEIEILLHEGVEVRDFGDGREPKIGIRFKYRGVACRELSLSAANPKTAVSNVALAHAKVVQVRDEINRGVFKYGEHFPDSKRCALFGEVVTKGVKCKTLLDDFMSHVRNKLDLVTYGQYERRLRVHVRPTWDKRPLAMLTVAEVVGWIKELADKKGRGRDGKGMVMSSGRQMCVPFSLALDRAVQKGLIKANPFSDIKLADEWPREQRKTGYEPQPFNEDERKRITVAATRAWRLMFTVWVWGGYRPEEIVALKWTEVDFAKERVRVSRVNADGRIVERTKTDSSARWVPMIGPVKAALREQRELTGLKPHGFVFENPNDGKPWAHPKRLASHWEVLLKRAKVAYRSIKQLRHTFASMMLKNGEAIETLSKILGHKHSGVTRQYYARMIEETTQANVHGFALRGDYSKVSA